MKKPTITLREPPRDLDAFVANGPAREQASTPERQHVDMPESKHADMLKTEALVEPPPKKRGIRQRANGRLVRHMQFYFSPEVAERLELARVRTGRDMSELVEEMVVSGLDNLGL